MKLRTKKFLKALSITLIICLLSTNIFASTYTELINEHEVYLKNLVGDKYQEFLNNIGKGDLDIENACYIHTNKENKNLIIGSSGVVNLGQSLQSQFLDQYSCDVIGFGGTTDRMMLEWIPYIKKRYEKIIILNGVNTVNVCLKASIDEIKFDFVNDIVNICNQYSTLLKEGGKIIYMNIELFNKIEDEYNVIYNEYVKVLNPMLLANNVPVKSFNYQVGEDGLHSKNKEMFKNLVECAVS